jgi:hypothetical protein
MKHVKKFMVLSWVAALALLAGCEAPLSEADGNGLALGISANKAAPRDTWTINSPEDMAKIGVATGWDMDDDYVLRKSIELPANWIPTGPDNGSPFIGTFDGRGNTITLTGFDSSVLGKSSYLGVFGYVDGTSTGRGDITNLTVNVTAGSLAASASSVYIGALAGYAAGSASFDTVAVTGGINVSGPSRVYGGGVVGYGNHISINKAASSASVTVNGNGYDTSAGGVAGYVTNAGSISASSATGSISVTATNSLMMVYGGGLLGYTGNQTVTTTSYATGNVNAAAAYPYAGGLVGYNYGDLSGGNGSRITESYASGNVTATSDTALPYAGGLVGYNSSKDSVIGDCYATGDVSAISTGTGFSWAGGLAGANARDAMIANSYARGNVTSNATNGPLPFPQPQTDEGALAGGIAGYNYYTASTVIGNSVALNANLRGTGGIIDVYRVVGRNGNTTSSSALLNNWASNGMKLTPSHPIDPSPNGVDGGDTNVNPAQSFYTGYLGWNFTKTWKMNSANTYPILQWQTGSRF